MLVQHILRVRQAHVVPRYGIDVTNITRTKPISTSELINTPYQILKIDHLHPAPFSIRSTVFERGSNSNTFHTDSNRSPPFDSFRLSSKLWFYLYVNVPKRSLTANINENTVFKMVHARDASKVEKSLTESKSVITNNRKFHINSSVASMAKLIDGKQIASEIRAELREQLVLWKAQGHRAPQLTAILIGDDPASATYVNNKMKAAEDVGINSKTERYNTDITEEELINRIDELNADDEVDGILVQLPVPDHINERKVCNTVSCDKDVDGFNERNVGRLCLDMNTLIPCTPLGVQELIKRADIETFGKNAVVVGRSKNVGMPIAMLLHADGRNDTCAMDATVTICHRFTPPEELKRFCRLADIIVTATGVPGLITADMVKEGAAVIDVGITRVNDPATGKTKLVGDVDFENVRKVAGYITPVPGGVGPMTVAMLMKNTVIAAKNLAVKRKEV
ncbi:bifunctional methylenetetrahydrofolate dehydrogenase/cyclohydrolase, mitochondrial isoform X1 [Anopheles ziemanni]|uniref:bifunctional methylenetetrahydrofolate dehydrogenase/cyclohydrolase, mitochondrial isoform X1 n=2 Tax=Anopheles coustani TaxID=139045 RepID=UPI00265A6DD7|nr:bifunctional methylenetetrahydrofolate dehydrogenase/cyclohydrolase, mitochondrial isoform X1 [Anopheles coustani]XP_058168675.1 bifunctional methylenetetrahydrofolate dehydrogenase/cyclohydrolase, mitochondrial isoform X1 [Anopheles ziemanni]